MAKTSEASAATTKATVRRSVKLANTAKKVVAAKRPAAPAKTAPIKAALPKAPAVVEEKQVKSQASEKQASETKEKSRKAKLVRDSFTMPEAEYAVLGDVKKTCLKAGIEVKKSELLRVGVALLRQLDLVRLKEVLDSLPALKAGRPKKSK